MPSLKPGEVITWVKVDQPRLALGEILASSVAFVTLAMGLAVATGVLLGHLRSRQKGAHGNGGLGLR